MTDPSFQESGERLRQVIAERTGQLQEMRRQLSSREQELSEVTQEMERERERGAPLEMEMERLQSILREKESLIQVRDDVCMDICIYTRTHGHFSTTDLI